MPNAPTPPQQMMAELKVSAHMMPLDAGVYCVLCSPGSPQPDPTTGLPAVRISVPPGTLGHGVSVKGLHDDGWLGAADAVSLIRVEHGPAYILITIYQTQDSGAAPQLQFTRVVQGGPTAAAAPPPAAPAEPQAEDDDTVRGASQRSVGDAEIIAHTQVRGDVLAKVGEWIGERGSKRWIEGFALAPRSDLTIDDVEYQAVLGRGWMSPWAEGGAYCGSRGMGLPILGLRVRVRGKAADGYEATISATFTDGTSVGPLADGALCEAESLAPLEAFRIDINRVTGKQAAPRPPAAKPLPVKPAEPKPAPVKPTAMKPAATKPAPVKPAPAKAAAPGPAPARPAPKPAAPAPKGKAAPIRGKGR